MSNDGLLAAGHPPSPLNVLEASKLTAIGSLRELWRKVWIIDEMRVEKLQAVYGAAAQKRYYHPSRGKLPAAIAAEDKPSALRVTVEKMLADQMDIDWGESDDSVGYIQGAKVICTTQGKELAVQGTGGRFKQEGWPEFAVDSMRLHFARPRLQIEQAALRLPGDDAARIGVSGKLDFTGPTPLALAWQLERCSVRPFLPKGWSEKLSGRVNAKLNLGKELSSNQPIQADGSVELEEGRLVGIDALDKVASITHKPEFRRLRFHLSRLGFRMENGRLQVDDFRVESKGLVCAEGALTVAKEQIEGTFQLGVAPSALASIPGARERVFTDSHDGYAWTTVKITGPMSSPRDNLRARLIKAAEAQIASDVLKPVSKPSEEILNLLRKF